MFSIFPKLKWFIRTYRKGYLISIAFILFSYGLVMVPPWMIGVLADRIVQGTISLSGLYTYLGGFLIVIVIAYGSDLIWQYVLFKGSDVIARDARVRIVSKLLKQSPRFYEQNSTGSLMGKATNDINSLSEFAGFGVMALMDSTVYPTIILLLMATTLSWKLTLLSILPLPLLIVVTKMIGDRLYTIYDRVQRSFDRLNEGVLENVAGVRVVRAYRRESSEFDRFREKTQKLYDDNMAQVRMSALFTPISKIIPGFSYVLALGFGALFIKSGEMSIGNMISFIVYLNMLVWPMFALGEYMNVAERAMASMDRIQELWNYSEDMVDEKGAKHYPGAGDIEWIDFSFSYPSDDRSILSNIHLKVPHGSTLGVVGKIGSGKTTLLKQLLRFYPVDGTQLRLNHQPIDHWTMDSIREKIGYVPQRQVLFSKSAATNIAFGKPDASTEEMDRAIDLADFKKDLEFLSHGLDTMVGEKGIALSGGQKQRISIARALMMDPEILILDDSLSAVDAKTEENIIRSIKAVRENKTTLIAAHRLSGIMHADQIIVLSDGKIVERGTHEELMSMNGWYQEQFAMQQLEKEEYETV